MRERLWRKWKTVPSGHDWGFKTVGLRTLIYLALALVIVWGFRTIYRDWRKKFAEDDKKAEAKRKAQLERNRQEAKKPGVIDLKRGDDGVYRPGDKE